MYSKRFRQPRTDLTGKVFGKLTVLEWAGGSRWACVCDCGRTTTVLTANLNRGNTASCGCVRNIKSSLRNTTHGLSSTLAYKTWINVRRRCREVNHPSYPQYGGRGINICDKWHESVEAFVCDVGQPPSESHTLDRINNAHGYEPGNVRWATPTEQARNRSVCVALEFQGRKFVSVSEFVEWLAPQIGVNRQTLERELQKRL